MFINVRIKRQCPTSIPYLNFKVSDKNQPNKTFDFGAVRESLVFYLLICLY